MGYFQIIRADGSSRGFFNLFPGGQWLTFAKRPEKHILNLLPKLISEDNRYYINVRTFPEPILFLAGFITSWEHGQHQPTIFVGRKDDEDLSFLPRESSLGFGIGSPLVSINNEPPRVEAEPMAGANSEQMVENIADSGGVDNAVNDRAQELLKLVEQMKGGCDVLKERKKARDKECEDLKAKWEAAMADFDNIPAVNILRQKIKSLSDEVKEHKASLERMLLESKKWAGYQVSLSTLVSRTEVVSKVVPYVAMELVQSDEMDMLVVKLVSSVIFYGRCHALEEVASMKEPFKLTKVKDPFVSIKSLLSKKPQTLQRQAPTRTLAPAPSSQKDTMSFALVS
ncbi:hypothetical protein Tco_1153503 [Tanacetum coccineum]